MTRNRNSRRKFLLWFFLPLALVIGCGRGPARCPVTGQVVFEDGTPLRGGNVEFRAGQNEGALIVIGTIGEDGKFELMTRELGKGAVPGDYAGIVVPATPNDLSGIPREEQFLAMHPIDDSFRDYETSPVRIQVTDDASHNDFRIEVRPPQRKAKR